jgi:predicted AAA+ superfamily ATPase
MAHSLILGMTESGKTTLAKQLAAKYKKAGINVLVLDPLNDPTWCADFQTTDPDEFLSILWQSRKCAVFIDEAGESAGRYDKAMIKTATKGRHWGHNVHYLTQRGALLSTTIRGQCSQLFLFLSGKNDGKLHAEEWAKDELKNCNNLNRGEFFHTSRGGILTKNNAFK